MSCLLLSRLIVSARKPLSVQVKISNVVSWADSKVALYWVKSEIKKWKIWVENRVSEIRENIGIEYQLIVILQTLLQDITKN